MTLDFTQKETIIIKNPNKKIVKAANDYREKLMLHLHGVGMDTALKQLDYFENTKIYGVRAKYAVSNKDLFKRLLNDEEQVFTARGGSAHYNMSEGEEAKANKEFADVRYGMSLHKWMQQFGLSAYRGDPRGLIFIESEPTTATDNPKCYPTYKSTADIHDYKTNGRKVEYCCFKIKNENAASYGIAVPADEATISTIGGQELPKGSGIQYFRFVDDKSDCLYKQVDGKVIKAPMMPGFKDEMPVKWGRFPGFIISDLIQFDNPATFASPIDNVVELADCFLRNRSVKDLQQMYHGFAKAYELAMKCNTCDGTGSRQGVACPDCTEPGKSAGTGYRLETKVGDVAKIPAEFFAKMEGKFKMQDAWGYITPDIKSWEMQVTDLTNLENMMGFTYWGVNNAQVRGYNGTQDTQETATETLVNLQPKYARMNCTADWAENTERMAANFLGEYYFGDTWKGASISYGREYMLETPQEVFEMYQIMIKGGCPDCMLDEQFEKYIKCLYQNNPIQQAKYLKLFDVEPFPHRKASEVEASPTIPLPDKLAKVYFGEWEDTLKDEYIIKTDAEKLRADLTTYVSTKVTAVQDEQKKTIEMNAKTKPVKKAA